MVSVAELLAEKARLVVHLDCAKILTAQIVEIRDVVIRFDDQCGKAMVFTMLSGHPVRFFGLGKFVEADVAHSQVTQHNGDVQRIAVLEKTFVSALIQLHGIIETILPVVDIGKIAVQPRQSKSVSEGAECRARLICQLKRSLVLSRIDERLHHAADGKRSLQIISGLLKTRTRPVVFLYRLPIISIEGNHVPKSPGTLDGYRRIVE